MSRPGESSLRLQKSIWRLGRPVFFKVRIGIAPPSLLGGLIGTSQNPFGPLHRESHFLKQPPDMSGSKLHRELFGDHASNHGRVPNAGSKTPIQWSAIDDFSQS